MERSVMPPRMNLNAGYKESRNIQQALFNPHRPTPSLKTSAAPQMKQPQQSSISRIQSTQRIDRPSNLGWVATGSPRQTGSPVQSVRGSPHLTGKNELLYLLTPPVERAPLMLYQKVPLTRNCISHPQRASVYYIPETPEVLEFNRGRSLGYLRGVCQQCAVKIAFHKILVEEIDRTEQIEENLRVVSDWSHGLEKALSFQQEALGILTQKAEHFQQYCQEEFNYVQEFEGYINQFVCLMQAKLTQVKSQILGGNEQEANRLEEYRAEIQENVESLRTLLQDIEGQHQNLAAEHQPEEIAKMIAGSEKKLLEYRNSAWNRITSSFVLSGLERVDVEQIAESAKVAHEWFKILNNTYSDNYRVKSMTQGLIKDALQPASTSRRSNSLRPLQDISNQQQEKTNKKNFESQKKPETEQKEELVKPLLSCNDFSFDKTEIWESMIGNEGHNKSTEQEQVPNNQPLLQDLDGKSAIMNTKEIENILEGVSKSQANTSKYYQAYIQDEPIIVISPDENVNPDQQTPELGEKLRPSAAVQEKLAQLLPQPAHNLSRQQGPSHGTSTGGQENMAHAKHTTSTLLQQSEVDSLFTYLGNLQQQTSANGQLTTGGTQSEGMKGSVTTAATSGVVGTGASDVHGQTACLTSSGFEERRASAIKCQKILFQEQEGAESNPN